MTTQNPWGPKICLLNRIPFRMLGRRFEDAGESSTAISTNLVYFLHPNSLKALEQRKEWSPWPDPPGQGPRENTPLAPQRNWFLGYRNSGSGWYPSISAVHCVRNTRSFYLGKDNSHPLRSCCWADTQVRKAKPSMQKTIAIALVKYERRKSGPV